MRNMENIATSVGSIAQIASVSLETSCSEHLHEWKIMTTKAKEDERKFIIVYRSI